MRRNGSTVATGTNENREQNEFVQELDEQREIAESLNLIAGSVSTTVGGSQAALSRQTKIEHQEVVREPEIAVRPALDNLPGTVAALSRVALDDERAVFDGSAWFLTRLNVPSGYVAHLARDQQQVDTELRELEPGKLSGA